MKIKLSDDEDDEDKVDEDVLVAVDEFARESTGNDDEDVAIGDEFERKPLVVKEMSSISSISFKSIGRLYIRYEFDNPLSDAQRLLKRMD